LDVRVRVCARRAGLQELLLTDYFEENGTFHEDFFMDDVEEVIALVGASPLPSDKKKQ
jgi:hypothetical protein